MDGRRTERDGSSMPPTWSNNNGFASKGQSQPMEEEKTFRFRVEDAAQGRREAPSQMGYRESKYLHKNNWNVMRRYAEAEDVPLRRAALPNVELSMTRYSKSAEFDMTRRRAQRYGNPEYYARYDSNSVSSETPMFPPIDRHGLSQSGSMRPPSMAPLEKSMQQGNHHQQQQQQPAPPDTPAPKLPTNLPEFDENMGRSMSQPPPGRSIVPRPPERSMPPPPPLARAPRADQLQGATDLTVHVFKSEAQHPMNGTTHNGIRNNMGSMGSSNDMVSMSMNNPGSVGRRVSNVASMGNIGMERGGNTGAMELTKLFWGNKGVRNGSGPQATMCEVCGKVLATLASKNRHLETHSNSRRYGCPTCGKRFRQNAHLKKHMRLHTGEKPFSCPHCDKRFTQKGTLTGHIRTKHTKETPIKCPDCNAGFPTRNHLRAHKNRCPSSHAYGINSHLPAVPAAATVNQRYPLIHACLRLITFIARTLHGRLLSLTRFTVLEW